ncbi:hypothetical protein B0H12DRAFT_1324997 [Mycena haematopus]|nr:hypothetical protein B0H12DRAFT_1324997 [Mycena haematopus]
MPGELTSVTESILPCYITSIPPEVLSRILLICAHHNIGADWPDWPAVAHNIPVHLTHICSSWRLLAFDTPELWSSVALIFNKRVTARSFHAITTFADYWLAKGRRGKLDLRIHMGFNFGDEHLADVAPIARLLAAQARDWQKLTFGTMAYGTEYIMAWMAENAFPSLEEIRFATSLSSFRRTRFDALAALPRLHTVLINIWGDAIAIGHRDPTLLSLPLSQLRSFSLSALVSGPACLDILTNSPELTTLSVHVLSDNIDDHFRPPVTHSKLSWLGLTVQSGFDTTSNIESLLGVLHLPMLIDLNLWFNGPDLWNPLISRFWEGHGAQLRTLKIGNLYLPAADFDLRFFFLTVPNLTSLELSPREFGLTKPVFEALRVEQLLPALTCLIGPVGHAQEFQALDSIRSIIAFLEARAAVVADLGVARLTHVTLADQTDWRELERDIRKRDPPVPMAVELERLHVLKAQGMDVRWYVGGFDLLVPRYDVSIHTPSSRSPSSADRHSDSDAAIPTPTPNGSPPRAPKKLNRNPLRRLYQWMKKFQRGFR